MRPAVPVRHAHELLRVTRPDQTPRTPEPERQPERHQKPKKPGGWWLGLLAVPVLCCAGPALLAAIGIGSVGALLAAGTGRVVLAVALALTVLATVAVLTARTRRRTGG